MKLISSLIASCLAFTYASNDTATPAPTTTDMSTTMYTTKQTVIYQSKVYDAENDPTEDFSECDYFWMGTFTANDMEISICGYTMDDDDTMGYTDIKLDFVSDRWAAFGMSSSETVSDGELDDTFTNFDGYNIIIPINSAEIEELWFNSDRTEEPTELERTLTIISDTISDKRRTLRLMRYQTIADVNNTGFNLTESQIDDYYFNFAKFVACGETARFSATFGPTDGSTLEQTGERFTQETYGNREARSVELEEEEGSPCDDNSTDDANNIMIFGALIIGFIAIMLFY